VWLESVYTTSQCLEERFVSVTTDGFITDVKDLEGKILKLPIADRPLFTQYYELRSDLLTGSGKPTEGLELKQSGKGIIS
jgi:hypothetical protein